MYDDSGGFTHKCNETGKKKNQINSYDKQQENYLSV